MTRRITRRHRVEHRIERRTEDPLPGAASSDSASAARYDRAARVSAATVIRQYSTSFGMACTLLGREVRTPVRCIYALVRVADEIVDGASAGAGVDPGAARRLLDDLERETLTAVASGFSTNLVVHAFALTCRQAGIGPDLIRPFFASMRADLGDGEHCADSLKTYVYGSAEVVGLMCLRVFLAGRPVTPEQEQDFERGARRLGAAFQKVNFLRDLSEDYTRLGRAYLPGTVRGQLTEHAKAGFLDEIDDDLAAARTVIDDLPSSARTAVLVAHDLFAELSHRLRAAEASQLLVTRVRVPDGRKVAIVLRATTAGTWRALTTAGGSRLRDPRNTRELPRHRRIRGPGAGA